MTLPKTHRITMLLYLGEPWGREIAEGISQYIRGTRASWELFIEHFPHDELGDIENWQGDGIIAGVDNTVLARRLAGSRVPIVGVGCSFADPRCYPDVPYVCCDDRALVWEGYQHLVGSGLRQFALFSLPPTRPGSDWVLEREHHYREILTKEGLPVEIFRGGSPNAPTWGAGGLQLIEWLQALPKPVGIVAVNDHRARQLLQACLAADIAVPSQVAIIGIDDDPLGRLLTRVPLSSVRQPTQEIGRQAAQLLHSMLGGVRLSPMHVVLPPAGVNAQVSSRHEGMHHPHVMRARHFIRQYACQGVRSEQVADYVGIGRSSLETHFRRELNRSVHDEMLRVRLEVATDLLSNESTPIAKVAVLSGFTTVQYMHAVFRRELGCTPKQYRDRAVAERATR